MKKVKVFYKEESPLHPGKWLIRADFDAFYLNSTEGSFNIIQARLMGLTYAQYLRMCRDVYEAEIIGKDSLYPVAYFQRSEKLENLLENLNARANLVLWEREHPDFEKHAQFVKTKNPRFYAEVTGNDGNS